MALQNCVRKGSLWCADPWLCKFTIKFFRLRNIGNDIIIFKHFCLCIIGLKLNCCKWCEFLSICTVNGHCSEKTNILVKTFAKKNHQNITPKWSSARYKCTLKWFDVCWCIRWSLTLTTWMISFTQFALYLVQSNRLHSHCNVWQCISHSSHILKEYQWV